MRTLLTFLLTAAAAAAQAGNWHVVWSDEFNGSAGSLPDASKWTYDLGAGGWGNQELETYTRDTANIHLDGEGHLVIRSLKGSDGNYTSSRIKTEGKYAVRYGRIEARMKIPHGQGIWPAFWMLGADVGTAGWPKCGEIDTMENIGKEPNVVHGTVHGPGYSGAHSIGHPYTTPDDKPLSDDFHVYGVEWEPQSITFLLDGHAYFTVTPKSLPPGTRWVYDHPFFLLLNVAVGGAWPGNPDETTVFPQELLVDWVRVSQR